MRLHGIRKVEGVVLDFAAVLDDGFGLIVMVMYYKMCVVVVLWRWTVW